MVSMNRFGLVILFCSLMVQAAQQSSDYLTVEIPIGTQPASNVLWVKWTGSARESDLPIYLAPDSGTIYFDLSPGGAQLENYRYKVTKPWTDTATGVLNDNVYLPGVPPRRGTAFRPIDQEGMRSGVFYCVVALPLPDDTLYSNEFQIYIESPDAVDWIAPNGSITELTPTFKWNSNPGVPYYHVILSDEAISIDSAEGNVNLQGLSVIWQAITPNTQIVYGAPDPSKTLSADPPPLSPGQQYTWIVLNNYGNHAAFSSARVKLPPGEFSIEGESLRKPICLYPLNDSMDIHDHETIEFKWTSLDPDANTYKVYVYVGSDFEGINAKMVVWQTEVAAGVITDSAQTLSVSIDAASILTTNKYIWRVIAVDDKGAGTTGDTAGFKYTSPTGTMKIHTREHIVVTQNDRIDTIVGDVGLVEVKVEVLDGSMEAPLLFYTDNNGNLTRKRPTGTYRITAIKEGFENSSRTVVLAEGDTIRDTLFMVRPDATVYGKVKDVSDKGINLARVYGISDRGDTVETQTDALGNFILNCYAADWQIAAEKTGYKTVVPRKVTIESGQNYNFNTVVLEKNPYTLSGIVKNTDDISLLGVKVRLYQDGVLIDEVPSTSQAGTFSFTIPPGTYTITSDKAGFSSYTTTIDVLSSKSINISMAPGATMISGVIVGRSWVSGREVFAPITNAHVSFIGCDAEGDTFSTTSDAIYGNFSISLPGDHEFAVLSKAQGYISSQAPDTVYTQPKATQTYNDTLQGLGMVSGVVKMTGTSAPLGDIAISLISVTSGKMLYSGKSSGDGYFELRNMVDGTYLLRAGKEGLVLDSIVGNDTIVVTNGESNGTDLQLFMLPGDKTIKWHIAGIENLDGSVKLISPIRKTMGFNDTLSKSGAGDYIVVIDADPDSVIDLSYHQFTVGEAEEVHIDTVEMDVVHNVRDTVALSEGKITLQVKVERTFDSAFVYFRDLAGPRYARQKMSASNGKFECSIMPQKDGSTMLYYFKLFIGSNVYGYDNETFACFIKPDLSRLSKFEIFPSASDTLVLPSEYNATFTFRGYYSASYIPATDINGNGIKWSMSNAQGSELKKQTGTSVTILTGKEKSTKPVSITITIDTTKIKVRPGVPISGTVLFRISGTKLSLVRIKRVDDNAPNPITTSPTDRAEFRAEGMDKDSTTLTISPKWSIIPSTAGTMTADGIFTPSVKFVGFVRVFAAADGVVGEFSPRDIENGVYDAGLAVRYIIRNKDSYDTASNEIGCSVIFPPNVVGKEDLGLLELSYPYLQNQIKRGSGKVRMADSLAYEINQLENVKLDLSEDSLRLVLGIPDIFWEDAKSGKTNFQIAQWIQDSLKWRPLLNSVVAADGKTVQAALTHFSRYAIVAEPGALSSSLRISPNPFSPYIKPIHEYGINAQHFGTCIRFRPEIPEQRLRRVTVHIYNIVGDRVWAMEILNAKPQEYSLWWDGKTTEREVTWNDKNTTIKLPGKKMCRNGRYFVVLTVIDINGNEKRYMQPVVLMK